MNGNDTSLQIVLELVDNASKQLGIAQGEFSKFADGVSKSVEDASLPVIQFQEDIVKQAKKSSDLVINYWTDATDAVVLEGGDLSNLIVKDWATISEAAQKSASQVSDAWQTSSRYSQEAVDALTTRFEQETQQIATAAQEAGQAWAQGLDNGINSGITTAEESLSSFKSNSGAFYNVFRYMMLGSAFKGAGSALTGVVSAATGAASAGATTEKIQQLQAEIAKEKATIDTAKASLTHLTGTSAQMAAKQESVAATVQGATVKIEQYKKQLAPLEAAHKVSAAAAQKYAGAVQQLSVDWQRFLAGPGAKLLTDLTKTLDKIDKIVVAVTKWTDKHPKLTLEIFKTVGVLGLILTVIGSILTAIAPLLILFSLFGVALSGAAVAGAALVAGLVAVFTFFEIWFIDHVNKWSATLQKWGGDLRRIIDDALSWVGRVLGSAWKGVTRVWDDAWNGIANTFKTIWDGIKQVIGEAVTWIEKKVSIVAAPIKAVASTVSTVSHTVGGAATYVGNAASGAYNYVAGGIGSAYSSAIHAFASGGIVTKPTLGLVGEAGPEAIIPLSAFAGGRSLAGAGSYGGAAGINVQIMGGYYLDRGAAHEIGKALAKNVVKTLRTGNYAP